MGVRLAGCLPRRTRLGGSGGSEARPILRPRALLRPSGLASTPFFLLVAHKGGGGQIGPPPPFADSALVEIFARAARSCLESWAPALEVVTLLHPEPE